MAILYETRSKHIPFFSCEIRLYTPPYNLIKPRKNISRITDRKQSPAIRLPAIKNLSGFI